ncbi:MAG: OpgC domain-containing protein [Ilumatobacter sp.]|uniref:OpgC domain-containing protein n=1 Tax=Ilumatobacter sp. TaxID=1967498 RepID=UPI002614ECDE|nr:OpgC domain-containing protein [Ilumatobacter sp.]MDJ0767951.1 OpgC domain-containing protein [Ilumatobacter sp.]
MDTLLAAPDPPVDHRRRWRYPSTGGRDRRLDLLRGYALAAMAINHFGLSQSFLHEASGRSEFLISAAEAFLFISGFTLGFISIGRTPDEATSRLSSRTWTVYLATIGISLAFGVIALTTSYELWGELEAGAFTGAWHWIGQVVTMQTAFNGADILIAYVLYLGAAVGALRLMMTGRSWIVVAAVGGLYALAQLAGDGAMRLGFASFRALIPNAPLFFGGLLLGYHRERVATWWTSVPFRRAIDIAALALAVALAWLHATGWSAWPELGRRIAGDELAEPLALREFAMPWVPLLVVGLYLRVLWMIVDELWVPLRRTLGWFLLPLGEASLFTFAMHLVAIPLVVNLAWWPGEEIGRVAATAWVMTYLAIIYRAVLLRRRTLDWLRAGVPWRELVRRRGPVVTVAALLIAVPIASASPVGAAEWGSFVDEDDELDERHDDELEDDLDEDLDDVVGGVIDAYVDGAITADEVIEMIPAEVGPADRSRVRVLLVDDPWAAETEIIRLLQRDDD